MQSHAQAAISGIALCTFLLLPFGILSIHVPSLVPVAFGSVENQFTVGSALFVGDIMLGRSVERYMEKEGDNYPFLKTKRLLQSADVTVGNFEATVPKKHVPTPNFTFKFSVKSAYMGTLSEAGFDILSLANNHSYDYGKGGYQNTVATCRTAKITCVGTSRSGSAVQSAVVDVGSTKLVVVALYGLDTSQKVTEYKKAIEEGVRAGDFTIAYIHWGDEYESTHNKRQETIAHALIEYGADAVIGHHPHVVQDIEMYQGKPIFYSLGNFVFDQYFNDEVQTGLGVHVAFSKDAVTYKLIPFTSIDTRSQPRIMTIEDRDQFLEQLLKRSALDGAQIVGPAMVVRRN